MKYIKLSYRAGARFNPQGKPEEEREAEVIDPDTIETAGVFSEDGLVNTNQEVGPHSDMFTLVFNSWRFLSWKSLVHIPLG